MLDIALVWDNALGEADIALSGPVPAAPVPAVNLIADSDTVPPQNNTDWPAIASTDIPPPVPGAVVWKVTSATPDLTILGAFYFTSTPASLYTGSVYVWIPDGSLITLAGCVLAGISEAPSGTADMAQTGRWQRLTSTDTQGVNAIVIVIGQAPIGAVLYYAAPQAEFGPTANPYQPGSANPGVGPLSLPLTELPGSDLLMDAGLDTAIIICLFTDAPADPGDVIPDGTTDPRGYWGDMPIDAAAQNGQPPDITGSKLWLLGRAVLNAETFARAESYAQAALAPLVTSGVVDKTVATATSPQRGWLQLVIDYWQAGSSGQFTAAWQNT
ncbi:MAG: hypothetical protein HIU82_02105 [Proteobacteria bacterium]|nr:hypothetical protein [Pseudomonadota bacterium]